MAYHAEEGILLKKGIFSFLVTTWLLTGTTVPASATTFQSHTLNTLSFSYVENLFDSNGTMKNGLELAPGDHLVGIISVNRIVAGGETIFTAGPTSQLTGIYAHKVLSIPPYLVNGQYAYDPLNPSSFQVHTEYGNPDLGAFTVGSSTVNLASILDPGAVLALWLDQGNSATSFTTEGTLADSVARATDGLPFLSAGIGNSGYFYSHTNQSVTMAELLNGAFIGQAFAGLEVLTNATGHGLSPIFNPGDLEKGTATPLVLSCDLGINPAFFSPEPASPWVLAGTGSVQVYPAPEPSTLALFGVAGSVMALCRLRKRTLNDREDTP
ncbi:protein of unknown function DUF1555 [Geobacter metallireducens RCH3]|nr:protein of unknown function DUF1555 [Geobacter metallireducens RCH3]